MFTYNFDFFLFIYLTGKPKTPFARSIGGFEKHAGDHRRSIVTVSLVAKLSP